MSQAKSPHRTTKAPSPISSPQPLAIEADAIIRSRSSGSTTTRTIPDVSTTSHATSSSRQAHVLPSETTPIQHTKDVAGSNYNTLAFQPQDRPSGDTADTQDSTSLLRGFTGRTGETQAAEERRETPWYRRIAEQYGSVSLDNKGSVARDHLALERTFLAWMRTSLAFASIGIAITQLFRRNTIVSDRGWSNTNTMPQTVPFSPLLGHAVPIELLPYLYHTSDSSSNAASPPVTGPMLLDQLLMLSPSSIQSGSNNLEALQTKRDAAGRIRSLGKPLGATFIGASIVVLLTGYHRYFESQYWIIRGKFPASRGSIALVAFIAGALIVASLVIVVVIDPQNSEKK